MSKEYIMKCFDGELNDVEEAQLKQHINSCSSCSEEFNSMKEIMTIIEKQTIEVEPPSNFEAMVMDKVDAIEKKRKENNSRMLVLLYNTATLLSIVLLLIFVADMKQVSIFAAFEKLQLYFTSFSTVTAAVFGVVGDIFRLIGNALMVVFEVAFSIVRSYYYVFIALIAILFAIQKLLDYVGTQAGRETR
jgi:predicted anti-sigma-YlaC factor YlaD